MSDGNTTRISMTQLMAKKVQPVKPVEPKKEEQVVQQDRIIDPESFLLYRRCMTIE